MIVVAAPLVASGQILEELGGFDSVNRSIMMAGARLLISTWDAPLASMVWR